ncbi:hypothetical protein E1I18_00540 [Mycoplasmopsis mucosicanis]|uniref:Uncharacterized protein n=1 Tax=Mycoplasmopsis mucosicanis TaxID=458208 RepID=A0A507SQK9_9BACT|nr:hypothetical protein [Mycoplasmopsis mucosicanis]TQC54079.1 hypothetical protein E1I18_00540 [Mycoplasmopsis mucosicanis]
MSVTYTNLKAKLYKYNINLVFKPSSKKESINQQSLMLLASMINMHIKPNSKILISLEGYTEGQYISKISRLLRQQNHQIFEYDIAQSVALTLDEYVMKQNNIDYLIKISIVGKLNNVQINLYDANLHHFSSEIIEKIHTNYELNPLLDQSIAHQNNEYINLKSYQDELCSNNKILKAFVNIKQRYKSLFYLAHNNFNALEIAKTLLDNLKNDYRFNNKKSTLFWLKFKATFLRRLFLRKEIFNLFYFDQNSQMHVGLNIKNKFKFFSNHELALLYLDFYFEEYLRAKFDISKFKVLLPYDSTLLLKNMLKQYNVHYEYFDENTQNSVLNDKSYIFAYDKNKFNGNPKFSSLLNNYYFFACLIWMLNSYTNRNNLLAYKYKKVQESFGKIKTNRFQFSVSVDQSDKLIQFTNQLNRILKSRRIKEIEIINKWNDNNFYLANIYTHKNTQFSVFYDFINQKLNISLNFYIVYEHKSVYSLSEHIKNLFLTLKIAKNFKKMCKIASNKHVSKQN